MNYLKLLSATSVVLSILPNAVTAELIVNGDFENAGLVMSQNTVTLPDAAGVWYNSNNADRSPYLTDMGNSYIGGSNNSNRASFIQIIDVTGMNISQDLTLSFDALNNTATLSPSGMRFGLPTMTRMDSFKICKVCQEK